MRPVNLLKKKEIKKYFKCIISSGSGWDCSWFATKAERSQITKVYAPIKKIIELC